MDCLTILAQAGENTTSNASDGPLISMDMFWNQITSLNRLEAFMFVSFGVVWLFYGWRVFKVLVVISFALLGLAIGSKMTELVKGLNNQFLGGLIGMSVLSVLSIPLMRWAVSLLGALAGAIFTGAIWYAVNLNPDYIWAGGLIGMVAGGMISFIVFRVAVILFSSMGGGALIVTGILALLLLYTSLPVKYIVFNMKWVLPVAFMLPMLIGLIAQHKFVKGSKEWEI